MDEEIYFSNGETIDFSKFEKEKDIISLERALIDATNIAVHYILEIRNLGFREFMMKNPKKLS